LLNKTILDTKNLLLYAAGMSAINVKISPEKLREARGNRTQEFVAEAVGVSRQYLSMIENGVCVPGGSLLIKLCSLYDVEFSDLIQSNGKKKAN